jgi:HSP20 family protein
MESLIRSPRRPSVLRNLQNEVDQLFESTFPRFTADEDEPMSRVWTPRMDLMESDDHYRLRVDLPGIAKEDVSITVEDNRLTIRGERKHDSRTEDENYVRSERAFGQFYRMLHLPASVNENKIKARFTDGVLSVELPKTEKSKPKKIKIA